MLVQRGFRDKLLNCGIDTNAPFEVVVYVKGQATYDICCFGLDAKEKLTDEDYLVFYNQPQTPDGAIKYIEAKNKATFQLNLQALPEHIQKLAFTVSIDGEGTVAEMSEHHFCLSQNGKELFHFAIDGSHFKNELTFISGEIYKKNEWRVGAVASGYNFGLPDMLNYYSGVQEETPQPAKQPVASSTAATSPAQVSDSLQTVARELPKQKVEAKEPEALATQKKPPQHCLIVVENAEVRSYPLEMRNLWLIGRSSLNIEQDIMLNSQIASRRHGCIQNIAGEWYYVDMGSLNGTYYNGEKIMPDANGKFDAIKLNNQDVLRIDSKDLDNPADCGVWMMFSTEGVGKQWETITLDKEETCIGRDPKLNDIQIPLPYVSGLHMKIIHNGREYFVMDCNSMAGTWLNGEPVKGAMPLREKDKIAFCDCFMVFTGDKIILNTPVQVKKKNSSGVMMASQNQNQVQNQHIQAQQTPEPVQVHVSGQEPVMEAAQPGQSARQNSAVQNSIPDNYIEGRPVVLKANIQSRKVPSNEGHGEKELIRDVRVEVQEGTLVALLGGAGAGKSTVMNCMNGMDTAGMTGTVEYNGVDLIKHFDRMKYLIGSVPQSEVFHESLTVEQELTHAARHRLPGDTKKSEIKERVDSTLRQLGIESIRKNRISKCSGGERRRVNIGIELVADRQLLCLDEPDAGLDPGNKRRLFETLQKLAHEDGKSILTIIHDVSDIQLFDKVIIMNKVDNVGRLAFAGTPKEAREHFGVDIKDVYQLMAQNPEKYIYQGEA